MDDRHRHASGRARHIRRAIPVDDEGKIGFGFGLINRSVGGRIDDEIGLCGGKRGLQCRSIRQINGGPSDGHKRDISHGRSLVD